MSTPFHVAPGVEIEQYGVPFVVLERQVREELQRLGLHVDARVVREVAMKIIPEVAAQLRESRGEVHLRRLDVRRHHEEICRVS